jgi:hypothetical protein
VRPGAFAARRTAPYRCPITPNNSLRSAFARARPNCASNSSCAACHAIFARAGTPAGGREARACARASSSDAAAATSPSRCNGECAQQRRAVHHQRVRQLAHPLLGTVRQIGHDRELRGRDSDRREMPLIELRDEARGLPQRETVAGLHNLGVVHARQFICAYA